MAALRDHYSVQFHNKPKFVCFSKWLKLYFSHQSLSLWHIYTDALTKHLSVTVRLAKNNKHRFFCGAGNEIWFVTQGTWRHSVMPGMRMVSVQAQTWLSGWHSICKLYCRNKTDMNHKQILTQFVLDYNCPACCYNTHVRASLFSQSYDYNLCSALGWLHTDLIWENAMKRKQHCPWYLQASNTRGDASFLFFPFFFFLPRYDFRRRVANVLNLNMMEVTILPGSPLSAAGGVCQQVNFMVSGKEWYFAMERQCVTCDLWTSHTVGRLAW